MPPRPDNAAGLSDVVGMAAVFAAVAVGAATVEFALVPAMLIGGAAWLAPKALGKLRRRTKTASVRNRETPSASSKPGDHRHSGFFNWRDVAITQSASKTVTFRVISTGLDFGWNYLLLGEVATAASLTGFSLIAAPTFYFLHETIWNRYWPRGAVDSEARTAFQISSDTRRFAISKTMAKTITFRTFASISEFSVNYFVVRDVVLATKLSAFSIVAGPFIYVAHERAWVNYSRRKVRSKVGAKSAPSRLLPAPSA